jgi:arylsulfatase A-like enzyme
MTQRPNIVFVLTDDQGYGELGCHGNPVIKTPNLDKLHSESVRLTDYHVGPTCAPTRAGLMTGHFHNSTGVWHTIGGRSLLRQDEYSIANAFSDAGYKTGLFGKWHLGDNYPYRPQDRGFQEVTTHGGGGIGNTPDYWGNNYNNDHYAVNGGWSPFEGYCTDIWFSEGLKFIERHKDDSFLCFITTNAPHGPFIVDDSFSRQYDGQVETEDRANFFGMISCIDENVGGLRRGLDELGLTENTILIFMTDNGTACGAKPGEGQFIDNGYNAGMRGIKGSEYDGGHRVPFFMHWPAGDIASGRDVDTLTANVDIMPTLMELCGIERDDSNFDGQSIASLIRNESVDWSDRTLVTDSQRITDPVKWRKSATMTQQWRLVNGEELYDIQSDPGQSIDIAADHPDVVQELRSDYDAWWDKVSEQFSGTVPIPIGSPKEFSVRLNSHDWRNPDAACAWNQSQVRNAEECNGYWEIDVAQPGTYRIELRRWPKEEDRPIVAGIPGELLNNSQIKNGYGGGKAVPVKTAKLKVGDHKQESAVTMDDKGIVFTVDLKAGETLLQSWFIDDQGNDIGAYYVYTDLIE